MQLLEGSSVADTRTVTLIVQSPVCSERTGTAAGPCWPSVSSLLRGRRQTRTRAPALLPPAGPPPPWRCSQIYSNPSPNPSPSLLHRGALLCRAGLDPYLSPSRCPERTTANQKPLLLLFIASQTTGAADLREKRGEAYGEQLPVIYIMSAKCFSKDLDFNPLS